MIRFSSSFDRQDHVHTLSGDPETAQFYGRAGLSNTPLVELKMRHSDVLEFLNFTITIMRIA